MSQVRVLPPARMREQLSWQSDVKKGALYIHAVSLSERIPRYERGGTGSIPVLRANRQILITDASRKEVITNMASHDKNGYSREGRQRMSLMINMSLSETAEVASRGSSDTDFIEQRALAATIKVNLYVIGSIPILQTKKSCSQLNWQSERILGALIHNLFPFFL